MIESNSIHWDGSLAPHHLRQLAYSHLDGAMGASEEVAAACG